MAADTALLVIVLFCFFCFLSVRTRKSRLTRSKTSVHYFRVIKSFLLVNPSAIVDLYPPFQLLSLEFVNVKITRLLFSNDSI